MVSIRFCVMYVSVRTSHCQVAGRQQPHFLLCRGLMLRKALSGEVSVLQPIISVAILCYRLNREGLDKYCHTICSSDEVLIFASISNSYNVVVGDCVVSFSGKYFQQKLSREFFLLQLAESYD
ncbi:hypothetical protein Trydic_g20487 [Trypoxylus dichotomus]